MPFFLRGSRVPEGQETFDIKVAMVAMVLEGQNKTEETCASTYSRGVLVIWCRWL